MPKDRGEFSGLIELLTSAAAAVTAVFGMFKSFLEELVPPIDDSQLSVGFVSFITVIVLLALTLLIRKKLTRSQTRTIAIAGIVMTLIAVGIYFPSRDFSRTYVYRYPPTSQANNNQSRHTRGELHPKGIKRVGEMTVAEAVYQFGGPDSVNAMGTLWSESSRLHIIDVLERFYFALTLVLTTAIFTLGIAVWRLVG